MKATGIMRRMDVLGRIVIPKEIRRQLGVKENDWFEMNLGDDGGLILTPHVATPLTFENICKPWEDMDVKERRAFIEPLRKHLDD